jgi:hypothetical protein
MSAWVAVRSVKLTCSPKICMDMVKGDQRRQLCTVMATTAAPSSQATPSALPPSVFTLQQTAQLEALFTIIRDKDTTRGDFLFYSDRIIRLLVEEGLNHLPVVPKTVETPTVWHLYCL